MKRINETIDPRTVFGRVMLVFFWGGLAADIVTVIFSLLSGVNPIIVITIAWTTVWVNMCLIYLKALLFKSFNNRKEVI